MCDYDSVAVYDGDSETDTLLGQWCGSEQPPSLTSKGNKMLVVLNTDRNYAFKGFVASYIGGEGLRWFIKLMKIYFLFMEYCDYIVLLCRHSGASQYKLH